MCIFPLSVKCKTLEKSIQKHGEDIPFCIRSLPVNIGLTAYVICSPISGLALATLCLPEEEYFRLQLHDTVRPN